MCVNVTHPRPAGWTDAEVMAVARKIVEACATMAERTVGGTDGVNAYDNVIRMTPVAEIMKAARP